jgi:spore germination protein GerM
MSPSQQKPTNQKRQREEEPLLPSTADIKGFFTKGRVIGAIAILLLVSFAIDRFPAKAPETASEPHANQLALIGANSPQLSTGATEPGTVMLYFNNGVLDPTMQCDKVFPVGRETNDASPEGAVTLLLAGPTAQESNEGYFTSLSPEVRIKNVGLIDGTAAADFDARLAYNVEPRSCRAEAVRAQIKETLTQFDGVERVMILVDGAAENSIGTE